PKTVPFVMKKRQSASFWFQCASVESRRPPAASRASSWTMANCSVSPIAHLVFGRLVEAWHRPGHPIRGPFDQLCGVDDRQAKQCHGLRRIGEPGGRLFLAGDDRSLAEQFAELGGEIAHGEDLVTADIDRRGRRVAMRETPQRLRGGVALPD